MFKMLHRLHPRGPTSRGFAVDEMGATLGPNCVLVRRTSKGFRCATPAEAAAIQDFVFGTARRPDWLFGQCCRIAKALGDGQIALAQIYGVQTSPPELGEDDLATLAKAAPFIKANFDPDEPRDWHGRWSTDGDAADTQVAESRSERKSRCISECNYILLRPLLGPGDDTRYGDFQRCINECRAAASSSGESEWIANSQDTYLWRDFVAHRPYRIWCQC